MNRRASTLAIAVLATALAATMSIGSAATAGPHRPEAPSPGTSGVGDPYFPLDGNGGYDVGHYDLHLRYNPATDQLRGFAEIKARTTQALSRFDLDLVGLDVRELLVNGEPARWRRSGQELVVTPRQALSKRERFTIAVRYDGKPVPLEGAGFIPTDDGFDIAGQPHVAASWYPVNDHPTDKASYTFHVRVPTGLEVVANGDLVDQRARGDWTSWTWDAPDPMASYLTTVDVGEFDLDSYEADGVSYVDAIDPDLFAPVATPTTGSRFAASQVANNSYKRLAHTITVPAAGATAGFTIARSTEQDWDYVFVEAHTVGQDDWTTLPDVNGHTTQDTGESCQVWPNLHPFITSHYQSVDQTAGTCEPTGATGAWWAATGESDGPETWQVDLTPYAGRRVELAISYVSDDIVQGDGVYVDDVVVSTGEGSTSFESGLDGWTVPGAPAGSPGNGNDWISATVADLPPSTGTIARDSLARGPEILGFLSSVFGSYPWPSAGGIVDDVEGLGFALETQTRPIYAQDFFTDPISGDGVVVHELAHQWYGDSLAVRGWKDIWLNEGFATYAEWLWSEHEGLGTAQETFDFFCNDFIDDDDPMWQVVIGDPGPAQLFVFPVYFRGAMTLHVLRQTVGDPTFFRILRKWARTRAGDNVTTPEFVALAERISGQQLDDLFQTWLYTPGKPALATASAASGGVPPASALAALGLAKREGLLDRR